MSLQQQAALSVGPRGVEAWDDLIVGPKHLHPGRHRQPTVRYHYPALGRAQGMKRRLGKGFAQRFATVRSVARIRW